MNAVDAINGSDIPVLIIHGTEDELVAYEVSSIISKINVITNPKVRTISPSEPRRSGHKNLFSDNSIPYTLNYVIISI